MLKSYKKIVVSIIACLVVCTTIITITIGITNGATGENDDPGWPKVAGSSIQANSQDIQQVKTAIENADLLLLHERLTHDYSQYSTVYIDDPRVQLLPEQINFLHNVRAKHPEIPALKTDGWLAVSTAQAISDNEGNTLMTTALAKANGHPLSANELLTMATAVGEVPAMPINPTLVAKSTNYKPGYEYKDIKIENDLAKVTFVNGDALGHALLVKTSTSWKIAGMRAVGTAPSSPQNTPDNTNQNIDDNGDNQNTDDNMNNQNNGGQK